MDRCALFVDAGYLLADGAMAVHGTRRPGSLTWDYDGLMRLLGELAKERTGLPLLRCYWYETIAEGHRTDEHDALTGMPGVKLRLATVRPGRREGVPTEIHRDLATLARNGAVADAVVVSAEDELAQVVPDVQALGVRVTLVNVAVDGQRGVARALRHECDDLAELTSAHLRPYVVATPEAVAGRGGDEYAMAASSGGRNGAGRPTDERATGDGAGYRSAQAAPVAPAGRDEAYVQDRGRPPSASREDLLDTRSFAGTGVYGAPVPAPPRSPANQPTVDSGPGGSHPQARPYLNQQDISTDRFGGLAPQDPRSPRPRVPQQNGSASLPPAAAPGRQPAPAPVSLAEAVRSAHDEGARFGASVAHDAPVLWLEAVLARKPRMPSDLEARLLQGSILPIDFLLHDEVRGALQQGFWDALERSRR